MFMMQISKGNKTNYAIFSENYLIVDDIFLSKKAPEHCATCNRVGPY